jgi:repressor LexA
MVNLGIHEGDIAIIKPQQDLKNGDLAVVVVDDEEGTLKKFYKKDKVIILEAANPDYPTRILSGSDLQGFHVVGKVVETRKRW